ncbi:MAG: hypothetical protein ACOY3P_17885 [Planctomycetota bacterium]
MQSQPPSARHNPRNLAPKGFQLARPGKPPAAAQLGIFELIEEMMFPAEAGQVPRCLRARLVTLVGEEEYGTVPDMITPVLTHEEVMIYFPTVLRDGSGNPVGMPLLPAGHRCIAWRNPRTAHWEAIGQPQLVTRFEMTAALAWGGSAEALAYCYDADGQKIESGPPAQTITVHDVMQNHSKMASQAGDTGAIGLARLMTDRGTWEILHMQTPGDFWGELKASLSDSSPSATVEVLQMGGYDWTLGGYNPFQSVKTITAYNPLADSSGNVRMHTGAVGDYCFCRWDMRRAFYWIMIVEPNAENWQTLDVVTRTTLSIDFYTKQYWHRYYTRQIKLPPFVTIGAEVEH